MSNLFMKTAQSHRPLNAPAEQIRGIIRRNGTVGGASVAAVLTTESRDSFVGGSEFVTLEAMRNEFNTAFFELHDSLSSQKRQGKDGKIVIEQATLESRAQLAFTGSIMASDRELSGVKSQIMTAPAEKAYGAKSITLEARGPEFHDQRSIYTPEAFQNYDLQNSRIFSALFNYSIVDFDDFTRTFWRPVNLSPESSFVELIVNVLTVYNGAEHRADGKAENFRRKNLVRAIADHTILHTDLTQAIPSKDAASAPFFMTKVAESVFEQAEKPVTTAPLLAGTTDLDYIGICSPGWLIKTGVLDQRDQLDPGVRLDKLYLALENDVLEFNVLNEGYTEFNAAPQGDRMKETLSWTTSALPVRKTTTNVDGTALTDLASVVSGELVLKIRIDVQAEINLETGDLVFNTGKPSIRSLQDKDGNTIAATDARFTTIADKLKAFTEIGFTLKAFRSNADRRQRGQLINIRQFAENVVVPWRDPIAAERPAAASGEQDTSDLTALLSATRIRIGNEGITQLFEAEQSISSFIVGEDYNSYETPATLGIGRHYVLPTYHYEKMDMLQIVDSLKSSERAADIQAAIVAIMRNRLAHAYTDSQYKAASDALSGGTAPKPKVALVCDPVVARYIIEPGELRTLVDFELIVIPVLDFRMRGKIRMVFVSDDGGNDVNYLNFGYLFWSPEHVLVANMSRTGAFNRETQVQPRYRHYVACPIMISIDIENIEKALEKVTLNVDPNHP